MSLYPDSITSKAAQEAMHANSNLNVLGALMALCESSLGDGRRMQALEKKVVNLCKRESLAQLRIMDKATGRKEKP